jgi:putative FmdB family regulatory protein
MPTYTYRCKSCKHQFETMQSMHDTPLTDCPECQKEIIRIIQPSNIQFKGSGFYINDSQAKSKSKSKSE